MKYAIPLLGVLFVTLKLLGIIGWSWWWVTLPFWGPWLLFLIVILFFSATVVSSSVVLERCR